MKSTELRMLRSSVRVKIIVGILLLSSFLSERFPSTGSAEDHPADPEPPKAQTITLDRAVHFLGAGGELVVVEAGTYRLEIEDRLIGLIPESQEGITIVEGTIGRHDQTVHGLTAIGTSTDQDEFYLGVLQPNGLAIETTGSFSGVQKRSATPVDTHVQSRAVAIAPDKIPPFGSIGTPKPGAMVRGTVLIDVQAKDNVGIQDVQILIDGSPTFCSLEKNAPYTCNWDTKRVKNGAHSLAAVVRDKANNMFSTAMVTVSVDNLMAAAPLSPSLPVSGHIASPAQGATVKGVVHIDVQGMSGAGIQDVQIFIDGIPGFCALEKNPPYTCNWETEKVPDGSHTLTATIRDKSNRSMVTAPLTVTVKNTDGGSPQAPMKPSSPSSGQAAIRGQLIVRYKDTATPQAILGVMGKSLAQGRASVRTSFTKADLLSFASGMNLQQQAQLLQQDPNVVYVEPNYPLKVNQVTPNDPQYQNSALWGMNIIQAPRAWARTTGAASVVVAVLDSGVDFGHPDLAANMWTNPREIQGDGIDNDGDGIVDDVFGARTFNWFADPKNRGNPFPLPGDSHGTHVAGTIAAVGNNAIGVVGVGWNTRIMAVSVMGNCKPACEFGGLFELAGGIQYAADHGAQIINFSGSICPSCYDQPFSSFNPSRFLDEHINYAASKGVLIVAAAGNDSSDNDVRPVFPASSGWPNVVAVAATGQGDTLAPFSNYGLNGVHIAAPGVSIVSTVPGGGIAYMSGTSMAAPHVAGAAALVKAIHPETTAVDVKNQLLRSVDKLSALSGKILTAGRLNLAKAVGVAPVLALNGQPCRADDDCVEGTCYPFAPDGASVSYCVKRTLNCALRGKEGATYGVGLTINESRYTCADPRNGQRANWLPVGKANGTPCRSGGECQSGACSSGVRDGASGITTSYCRAQQMVCGLPNTSGAVVGQVSQGVEVIAQSGPGSYSTKLPKPYQCQIVAGSGQWVAQAPIAAKPDGSECTPGSSNGCLSNSCQSYPDGKYYCLGKDSAGRIYVCPIPGGAGVQAEATTTVNGQQYFCHGGGGYGVWIR